MSSDWLSGSPAHASHSSSGGGNSSLWPDFLSNNPVSEAIGHGGDWLSGNPVTSVGARFFTGPHQLVDFATHDWIAGLYALGHLGYQQAREEAHHGLRGVLLGPLGYESAHTWLHDKNTLAGGLAAPLVKSYNTKYQTQNILTDLVHGNYGAVGSDIGRVGHNEAQDPFGTLLDLTVAGKALDAAHLASLERASAAGKLSEGSLRGRIASRVLSDTRDLQIHPSKDSYGNPYEGAKGVTITKGYRSRGTVGRLLQSYMDELRLQLPENLPFSAHRLSAKETLRQVNQVFQRNAFHIKAAAQLINKLPEGLQYAVQHVAELPRDVATIGSDPIGHMLQFYKDTRDEVAAASGASRKSGRLQKLRLQALDHRIEVLSRVNDVKEAIYDPTHPDHAQFMEAFDAARNADQIVRRELVRRGLVHQDTLDAQDVLVHRLLRGVRYEVGHPQQDLLGSYVGEGGDKGQTTEEALAQEQMALDSHAGTGDAASPHGPPVVHSHPLPADTVHPGRIAALIDRRTGEVHIADPTGALSEEGRSANAPAAAWHADLRQAAGISVDDMKDHYIQASTADAVPGMDIPRRWILPSDIPHDELNRIVDHLQQIENLPVETGHFEGMIPARASGEVLHNPLAQYGASFHWPHEAFAVVGAPVGLLQRVHDLVVADEPRSRVVSRYVEGMAKRPGDAWLEGLINSHPETLTTGHLHQWAEIRAKDFMDEFLYPMSGRLESGKGYEQGGKLSNESYILAPKQYTREPLNTTKTHFANLGELLAAAPKLRRITEGPQKETMAMWVNRLDDAGLRRVKTKYVERWKRETDTSRTLFQRIVHGGINQVWRYLLLAVKPGWAVANYYTNQALVLLKNAGKGGLRAYLAMVKDSLGHSRLRKLLAYTRRMSLSPETKIEVQQMIGESLHDKINRTDPALHASTFGRSRLFSPPRAGREVPVDAVTPQGTFLRRLARNPGYSARRITHILGAPARLVERMNQHGEEFTRDQAYLAKLHQMTGKMAHSADELQQILREAKITSNPEKMQELLMGPNGPMDALGDYGRMSAREREFVTAVIPFYSWYKTILGISAKFFLRDTGRIWVLHALAQGLSETAASDMQLGVPVPSFAKDLLPLFPPRGDSQLTVSTRTWNPFQTPVDLGNNLASFLGGPTTATPNEVGLGLLGPAFQGAYTAATGKDPFYGGEYSGWGSGQGRLGNVIGSFFYGLPEKRLADQLRGDYKSKVFEAPPGRSPVPGLSNQGYVGLLQYLGIPVKYVNLPNLQTRAVEEGQKPTRAPAHKAAHNDWLSGG